MTERTPPKIPDAPGLVLKMRKVGWAAYWQARTDIIEQGWVPARHLITMIADRPDPQHIEFIQVHCQRLQYQMLKWGKSNGEREWYDGTLRGLISCYQMDPDSPYRKLRHASRINYDSQMRMLRKEHGEELIKNIKARQIKSWHDAYKIGGMTYGAHFRMTILRLLFGFGATILENEDCQRVSGLLTGMRFEVGKPREHSLTSEHVVGIRQAARDMGHPMIALAQAFQFECTLRQKDVIGEWVPQDEPGPDTGIINNRGKRWMRGLLWSEIQDMTLRHTTSKRGKPIEVNLNFAPMVIEELNRLDILPTRGAIIIDKDTGLPYVRQRFTQLWRKAATQAGVPKECWNMDTRAGAITEATDSGASLEDVRHAATHSNTVTTQRYSRGSSKKIESVMQLRVARRNKPGTDDGTK